MTGARIVSCRRAAVACRTAATVGQVNNIRPFRESNGKHASLAHRKLLTRCSLYGAKRFGETMRGEMLESLIGENISLYSKRSKLHQIFSIAAFPICDLCALESCYRTETYTTSKEGKMGMETCHVGIGTHTRRPRKHRKSASRFSRFFASHAALLALISFGNNKA